MNPASNNNKLPPGEYYLGDPCYILSTEDYQEVIRQIFSPKSDSKKFFLRGKEGMIFQTLYGDGVFHSSVGSVYVDSGTVGLVPEELAISGKHSLGFCHLLEFINEFECKDTPDGVMYFGPYKVDTGEGYFDENE